MRLMEAGHPGVEHQAYRDDDVREQEGLHDELSPPSKIAQPLVSQIIGHKGRDEDEGMQMLLMGGSM